LFAILAPIRSDSSSSIRSSATTSGSVVRDFNAGTCDSQNFCWICKTAVNLDSVTVNVETNSQRIDAVKFQSGCTGTIGSLNVTTHSADGMKVAEGAHDLVLGGGSINCVEKLPTLHQDAVQVMGGSNIAFNNMTLNCGRANDDLIDSNFFINQSGSSINPPSQIVCDHCWLGPNTAHTVNLQDSSDSGVRNSTVCPGKYPRLTFTVGTGAVRPINDSNSFPVSC
jgi:hypothetical protein